MLDFNFAELEGIAFQRCAKTGGQYSEWMENDVGGQL